MVTSAAHVCATVRMLTRVAHSHLSLSIDVGWASTSIAWFPAVNAQKHNLCTEMIALLIHSCMAHAVCRQYRVLVPVV